MEIVVSPLGPSDLLASSSFGIILAVACHWKFGCFARRNGVWEAVSALVKQ